MAGRRVTRYAATVINKPTNNMSYPMNEFETDLENLAQTSDEWISSSSDAVGTALHEVGDAISSVTERGGNIYKAAGKRVAREAGAANAVLHNNPYPTVLAGIGAGALLGFLVARRRNGGSN